MPSVGGYHLIGLKCQKMVVKPDKWSTDDILSTEIAKKW